jgi:hypothetical protein
MSMLLMTMAMGSGGIIMRMRVVIRVIMAMRMIMSMARVLMAMRTMRMIMAMAVRMAVTSLSFAGKVVDKWDVHWGLQQLLSFVAVTTCDVK